MSGAKEILRNQDIDWDRIAVVISGEGRIDAQTAGGKVPETLRLEAEKRNIPFIAVAGYVEPEILSASNRSDYRKTSTPRYISCIATPEEFDPSKAAERLANAVRLQLMPHLHNL